MQSWPPPRTGDMRSSVFAVPAGNSLTGLNGADRAYTPRRRRSWRAAGGERCAACGTSIVRRTSSGSDRSGLLQGLGDALCNHLVAPRVRVDWVGLERVVLKHPSD